MAAIKRSAAPSTRSWPRIPRGRGVSARAYNDDETEGMAR